MSATIETVQTAEMQERNLPETDVAATVAPQREALPATRRRRMRRWFTSDGLRFHFQTAWNALPVEVRQNLATFIHQVKETDVFPSPDQGEYLSFLYSGPGERSSYILYIRNTLNKEEPHRIVCLMLQAFALAYDFYLDIDAALEREEDELLSRAEERAWKWAARSDLNGRILLSFIEPHIEVSDENLVSE